MSDVPGYWQRADLVFPPVFDTIFFDVDGVLIETKHSFRAATIATVDYICSTHYGLTNEHSNDQSFVSLSDIDAFKRAGGFNGDWDMCYLLSALAVARAREWQNTPLVARSAQEWASLARDASTQGCGGRVWVESVFPASALTNYDQVVDIFNECYWGADGVRKQFAREPQYLPQAAGFVHNEKMLFSPDFFARLRARGILHLGMITGRIGPEVERALEMLEVYCGERWWDVVIPADQYAKPDPQALRTAIAVAGTQGGLYIGDTADDFDLVRLYKAERDLAEPSILAAMVPSPADFDLYQQRGADIIVHSVEDLLKLVPARL